VAYTNTINFFGGSGQVVPLRVPAQQRDDRLRLHPAVAGVSDPNLPAGGKQPRSSMGR